MSRFASGWSGAGARSGAGPVDPAEKAGLYVRSLDEFLVEGPLAGGLGPDSDQSPRLYNQDGETERFDLGAAGDSFIDAVDVVVSLPGGELARVALFGDAPEAASGFAPDGALGWSSSPTWSADWFDFPGPVVDPWA